MLKITINEEASAITMKLEGRVAGLWTAEVGRAWVETAPRLDKKKFVLDVRDVTFADAGGTYLLSEIYALTHAKVLADTLWAQSLADRITQAAKGPLLQEEL